VIADLINWVAICPVVLAVADALVVGLRLAFRNLNVRDLVLWLQESPCAGPTDNTDGILRYKEEGRHVMSPQNMNGDQCENTGGSHGTATHSGGSAGGTWHSQAIT